jgi:hypothetical protein
MPTGLIHVEDADLDGANVDPGLLAAYRAYLPRLLEDRRGLLMLAAPSEGGHHLLMLLARRIGAALRDANIRLRDGGGDMQAGKLRLCYLPGADLALALADPAHRRTLAAEAACFVQDLEGAWLAGESGSAASTVPEALRSLLDERLAAGRPTFLQAAPGTLPPAAARELRARLPVLGSTALAGEALEAGPGRAGERMTHERADLGTTV